MAETIVMPKLGLDMSEGTFVNWVKKVGDQVKAGEVLAEVEADKATIEIESTATGVLSKTLVEPGQTITVGAPIAEIGGAVETPAPVAAPAAAPAAASSATPATPAVPATAPAAAPAVPHTNGKPVAPSTGEDLPGGIKASPIARRMADEKGIDLKLIQGTGPGGRITKSDIEAFRGAPAAAPAAAAPATRPAATPLSAAAPMAAPQGDGITEEPVTKLRARIAARMTESKQHIPHFYVTSEIDMGPAVAMRKQINAGLPDDQKVTINDLVIKAAALALRKYINLNSHFYGDKVVRYAHINIGIAVPIDGGGLMNVVAKDADIISISRLAQRNKQMIASARTGKVKPEDIEGGTFTVSNLGPYEVENFVAIINPPEAAILAVGSAKDIPVVIEGEIKIGTRMKATLSADHRITDGAEAAQYMQEFKSLLENPMRLLV